MMSVLITAITADLSKEYSFGPIQSVGEGFTYLVGPGFAIAALVVVIYFVVGGLRLLMSGGNKESVASARGMITHSIIAFLLLIVMFLLFQFVPKYFGIDIQLVGS